MSERRNRPKTRPLRASDLAPKTRTAAAAPETVAASVVESTTPTADRLAVPTAAREAPAKIKFTASLELDTADSFDLLARAARRKLGRQVAKLDVLTALISLAADDASLRDQMIDLIGERKQ